MPILQESSSEPARIKVAASAPLELMWVLHNCEADHILSGPFTSLEPIRLDLRAQLNSFWPDGVRGFTEMMVLAHRSGTVLDLDLVGFFAGLEAAIKARSDSGTSLRVELPADRAAIIARLDSLRSDRQLRTRYRSLLEAAWEAACPNWESEGRQVVAAAVADWNRRLEEGVAFRELLERSRIWPGRTEFEPVADVAAAEGRLVMSPGWYFGIIHVVDLDGTIYLGRGVRREEDEAMQRHVATKVAGNLKALADPTRLSILLWLGRHPASVTELASHFKLSQPTISAHVQLLREAGLLIEKPSGRSAKLSVSEQRLKAFFSGVEESLLLNLVK
jgi:DNA-binding transcriptional ArsR family regulator